jgi:phosphonate transport system ATP-binding protein
MNNTGPAVSVRDLWFAYSGERWVLRDVSMDVPRGAFQAIVGPSGSGKTTLLKLMAGFLSPTRGELTLLGEDQRRGVSHDMRKRLGYIPQQLGLVRGMSAIDNVLMGSLGRVSSLRSLTGMLPSSERGAAQGWLERLGIGDKANERVFRLSGGQRQRVAIARTLLQRPAIVFADEFVSDLDQATAVDIMQLVKGIGSEQGITFIFTLHEAGLVERFADDVVTVQDGAIVAAVSAP